MSDEKPYVKPKSKRGFASMSPERRKEIAAMGGKAVKPENRFYSQDKQEARAAGRKGLQMQGKIEED